MHFKEILIKLLIKLKQRLFYFIKYKYDLDNSHIFMKINVLCIFFLLHQCYRGIKQHVQAYKSKA